MRDGDEATAFDDLPPDDPGAPRATGSKSKRPRKSAASNDPAAVLELADARPPEFSDEAVALEFARRHADDLRFVAAWGKWFIWTGSHWRVDETLRAFDLARAVCRATSARAADRNERCAPALASAKTVAAVVGLARSDRRLAASTDQWDTDPWLLNTPEGSVDLRSGAMRPHRPEDYSTKITAVGPGGDCPLWLDFLDRIMASDADLVAYLRRVAGYALTGITRDHALFFGHGTGANGKSVFVGTISGFLGDYATTAPMETFIASRTEHHPTDLAGLRGARLVSAQETEQGRRWAESKIKTLTGGDRISARFMRQDFFEFAPQFKLLVTGNHKPGLRGVDEAIRRRFHLIPFDVTIPEADRDPELADKLKAEWGGILAWAIEGCAEWQADGLMPPAAVRAATASYLAAEDSLAHWLDERCDQDHGAKGGARRTSLFKSWRAWAESAGEESGSQKQFVEALKSRGFSPDREAGTGQRIIRGLTLRPTDIEEGKLL